MIQLKVHKYIVVYKGTCQKNPSVEFSTLFLTGSLISDETNINVTSPPLYDDVLSMQDPAAVSPCVM